MADTSIRPFRVEPTDFEEVRRLVGHDIGGALAPGDRGDLAEEVAGPQGAARDVARSVMIRARRGGTDRSRSPTGAAVDRRTWRGHARGWKPRAQRACWVAKSPSVVRKRKNPGWSSPGF